jgi:hypothetical protein
MGLRVRGIVRVIEGLGYVEMRWDTGGCIAGEIKASCIYWLPKWLKMFTSCTNYEYMYHPKSWRKFP